MATILIVDDTQFMRYRLAKLLHEHGFQTLEAENGEQALQVYQANRPDAVLMDITMPVKDGLTALAEIREYDPHAGVVMLTAVGQQAAALQAVKAGARDFVVKPYKPEQVLQAIARIVK